MTHPLVPRSLVERLVEVERQIAELRDEKAVIESEIITSLGEAREMRCEGLGTLTVRRAAKRTVWDSTRLLGAAIDKAVAARKPDPETGEILSAVQAIEKMLADCAAFSYWRLGALERYGLDGRTYRDTEWGPRRVVFEPEVPLNVTEGAG